MLYIHLFTNIKLMITWSYISSYTSTLKVSWWQDLLRSHLPELHFNGLSQFFSFIYLIWSLQTSNCEEIPYRNSLISCPSPFHKHVFASWRTLFFCMLRSHSQGLHFNGLSQIFSSSLSYLIISDFEPWEDSLGNSLISCPSPFQKHVFASWWALFY